MTSKVFFRGFEAFLDNNGISVHYKNGRKLSSNDYEDFYKLIFQFALAESITTEQDVFLSKWSKLEFDRIVPTQYAESKLEKVRNQNGLFKMGLENIMNELNDNKIVEII